MTLVELLVATTLSGLILAGALTATARAHAAYHSVQVENRLHEREQYVFATLEPELQMAGYFASALPPAANDALLGVVAGMSCGPELLDELARGIEFTDNHYSLPCPAQGQGASDTADVLTVRRASTQTAAPEAGRVQLLTNAASGTAPQLIVDGQVPAGQALDPPRTELRNLLVRSYYVARGADEDPDTPALRVKSLTSISGHPAFVDTEVMPGIDDLQIELLPDDSKPQLAIVTLGVRTESADLRAGEAPRRLTATRHFRLRNAR